MGVFNSFGKNPSPEKSLSFQQSANFKQGVFQNLLPTEIMSDQQPIWKSAWKFLNKPKNTAPSKVLPTVKTDLRHLSDADPSIVWFGHSSYFISVAGKSILVDPVLSGHASPFSFGVNSFAGTDIYSASDFPEIDLLVLTHDHYDHIDHRTLIKLRPKIKRIATSLGVSSHLTYWGFDESIITEFDWWDTKIPAEGITLTAAPARHFSGRTFKRNQTLWSSFILEAGGYKLYIGADSGYGPHFKEIGERFGPFDIVMLETGQYNESWPLIHMNPEEAAQAAVDLKARLLLPVHWSKFALAFHPWYEPVERVIEKAKSLNVRVTTPMIGELVNIDGDYPVKEWWKAYK